MLERLKINILKLKNHSIYHLLKVEEALLRHGSQSGEWLILNEGTPKPCIVMGSGSKRNVHELIEIDKVKQDQIEVIRRFTGGGTVFVDNHTLFVTFLGSQHILSRLKFRDHQGPNLRPYPREIMKWTEYFYRRVFQKFDTKDSNCFDFSLRENDYVLGEHKFGGNAQYLTGSTVKRWLHHTSFLWDFRDENMSKYLRLPERRPEYRNSRDHSQFLCRLSEKITSNSTTTTTTTMTPLSSRLNDHHKLQHGWDHAESKISVNEKKVTIIDSEKHVQYSSEKNPHIFLDAIHETFVSLCENEWYDEIDSVNVYHGIDHALKYIPQDYEEMGRTAIVDLDELTTESKV